MSWLIKNVDGSVTVALPVAPISVSNNKSYKVDNFGVDGQGSILVSRYAMPRKVEVEGLLLVRGASNVQLMGNYLVPLDSFIGQVVQLVDPDGQFDTAAGWLFSWNYSREQEGKEIIYRYKMTFTEATGTDKIITLGAV